MCLFLLFNEAQLIYHLKATVWGCNSLLDNCAKQWHQWFFLYKYICTYVLHSEEQSWCLLCLLWLASELFFKCAPRRKLSQVGSLLCACLHSSRLSVRGGRMLNPKCAIEGCQPEAAAAWRPLCAVAVPVEKYNRMCVHCANGRNEEVPKRMNEEMKLL